ncbi:putative Diamine N-acetyltransferase [Rhodotorula taiwanensis]|uniref:Putative Diamine N-acetyltransferase n=1 Tax=Rhodotorula taiwanensis TaxID=741276 RepID=A0A2S5B3D1_9BASI|nr:putative Diamine N-acetyltransferase [Rhodotorula taiwanensis]
MAAIDDPYERDSDNDSEESLDPEPEYVHTKVRAATDTVNRTFTLMYACPSPATGRDGREGTLRLKGEASDFGATLFHRNGKVKAEVDAVVAYLEEIRVKKEYRSQGIGTWALQQLLVDNEYHLEGARFTYGLPSALWSNFPHLDQRECKDTPAEVTAADVGLRRVGTSAYLCCAHSSNHLSHAIPADQDAEHVKIADELGDTGDETLRRALQILQRQNIPFPERATVYACSKP